LRTGFEEQKDGNPSHWILNWIKSHMNGITEFYSYIIQLSVSSTVTSYSCQCISTESQMKREITDRNKIF